MAHGAATPPMLRLKRSGQSASYAMTAAWQVVYSEFIGNNMAYFFAGAIIDLSTMAAGDTVNIRVRKVVMSGGDWVLHDQMAYEDERPARHVTVHIPPLPDVYGVEISMQQTAGVLRTIPCEFYDAKRLGLS